jgi:hypothetical protein
MNKEIVVLRNGKIFRPNRKRIVVERGTTHEIEERYVGVII